MHHDIWQIDEYPLTLLLTLDTEGTLARRLGHLNDSISDRAQVTIGGTARDHHEISYVAHPSHIEYPYVDGFHI